MGMLALRFVQTAQDLRGNLFHLRIVVRRRQLLHNNDALFIDRRDKILRLIAEAHMHALQRGTVLLMIRLQNKNHPARLRLDMKLFRAVIDVDEKQVVEQKIFDKIVLIKALIVGDQQVLHLKRSHLSDHVGVVAASARQQDIFKLRIVVHLEKLVTLKLLAVRRGINKQHRRVHILPHLVKRRRQYISLRVDNPDIHSADLLDSLYRILQNLI